MISPAQLLFAPFVRDADMAARAPWIVPNRRLLDYLLVYVHEGECRFTVNGEPFHLRPGDICLIQPCQAVELRGLTSTVTPYAHFDLFYNPLRESSFATRPGQMDLEPYANLMQPQLESLLPGELPSKSRAPDRDWAAAWMNLVSGWRAGSMLDRLQADQNLGSLLLDLLKRQSALPGAVESPSPKPLSWLDSYLSTHLSEPISVTDMARQAGLSVSRFQAIFRQAYGIPPARYLMELRVQHAAELLYATDWTLAHIGGLCGFSDVHHFAKTFRRLTGITPGQHRRSGQMRTVIRPDRPDAG